MFTSLSSETTYCQPYYTQYVIRHRDEVKYTKKTVSQGQRTIEWLDQYTWIANLQQSDHNVWHLRKACILYFLCISV